MMRKLALIILLAIFILGIYLVADFFFPGLPSKVKSDNILKITPGMTLNQLTELMGMPLRVTALQGLHNNDCSHPNSMLDEPVYFNSDIQKLVLDFIANQSFCCEGNRQDIDQLGPTLVYTKEGFFASYPMLWVSLDQTFRVIGVYAKEYHGGLFGNDPGIFSWNVVNDSCYSHYDVCHQKIWMNEESFYRCFK
jgi:hypothetical protein